jgi:hypothetical protein
MECETPKDCMSFTYKEMPPLAAGETVVRSFGLEEPTEEAEESGDNATQDNAGKDKAKESEKDNADEAELIQREGVSLLQEGLRTVRIETAVAKMGSEGVELVQNHVRLPMVQAQC